MLVKHVSQQTLQQTADQVGAYLCNVQDVSTSRTADQFRFVLKPTDQSKLADQYVRTSLSRFRPNRRIGATCWHGYTVFMAAIFTQCPTAEIRTSRAIYRGARYFLDHYLDAPSYDPQNAYRRACLCDFQDQESVYHATRDLEDELYELGIMPPEQYRIRHSVV